MRKVVIVDIDGTISKVGDRLKYLLQKPKDWDSFYEDCFDDKPIEDIINLVYSLFQADYDIIFCTGRRESVRNKTNDWFKKFLPVDLITYHTTKLLMRENNDLRHDTIVKPQLLKEYNIELSDIAFVLEDRNSMVVKWREMGLICLQVAEGDF